MNKFFILLVQFYQVTLGHFLGGNCRYYPSCSHYSIECFKTHTFLKALYLTTSRVLSCHPFSRKKLYDPPPESTRSISLSKGTV